MFPTEPFSGVPLSETLVDAFTNLRTQGQRSLLALLGILIGTASIIAMLNIGHMAQLETMKLFDNLGLDMIGIQTLRKGAGLGLDRGFIEALPDKDAYIAEAAPFGSGNASVSSGTKQANLTVVAMTSALPSLTRWKLSHGRFIAPVDENGLVAMLGQKAAADLSAPGAQILPGSLVRIGSYNYTIIGVLDDVPMEPIAPLNYNAAVYIPLGGAIRVLPSSDPDSALIRLQAAQDVPATTRRLEERLSAAHPGLQVRNAQDLIKAQTRQKVVFTNLLAAIGGISLLVGGIGVMNVMLMSVMERRREIGLRAAIGATPRDIQGLFVIEAATLSVTGGAAGAVLGIAVSYIVSLTSHWTFDLALYVLPLGPGVAGLVGVIFGFQPAQMASRLDPIEALRAE